MAILYVMKRLSQALVHFVTARASLFTDHEMSGLAIRATKNHFLDDLRPNVGQFSKAFPVLLFLK